MEKIAQLDVKEIKRRSVIGVAALTSRSLILQIISNIAYAILGAILGPEDFGAFFIVSAAINFLNYFSDIGLAAAVIQKKSEPTRVDLETTFTIQQLLVGTFVLLTIVLSKQIAQFYNLPESGLFLFQALAIGFLFSSLKTIPSVILERRLEFQKVVLVQIMETLGFYLVAITLALKGFGLSSFAWATLLRGLIGLVAIYVLAPWRPGLLLNRQSARELLAYGFPFQASSFLALVKDDFLTLYLGRVLSLSAVGYIGFAKKWGEGTMRQVMDNIIRITFPTFARLQKNTGLLAKAIHRTLLFLSMLIFPLAVGLIFLIRPLINSFPQYAKWEPALFSFYLFVIAFVLATFSTPFFNALNAIGKVTTTFKLQIFWTVLTWIFVPLLVKIFDYNGMAIALLLINLTSFLPLLLLKKYVPITFFAHVFQSAIATVIMTAVLIVIVILITMPILKLVLGMLIGGVVYSVSIYLLMGKELKQYIKLIYTDTQ